MCFARTVDSTTHDREMQRLLDMCEPAFDFSHDLDEVVDIESSACRACDDRHSAFAQFKRLQNFPADADFFVRLGCKTDADRVTDPFVQKNSEADSRFD